VKNKVIVIEVLSRSAFLLSSRRFFLPLDAIAKRDELRQLFPPLTDVRVLYQV